LDNILALLEKAFPKLKGLLPPIYAGSNLDKESVAGLINLFSKDIFRSDTSGVDMLGRVYEYFIGEFANSEGKRGGEYFTPQSIVRTIVAMLEPTEGKVFDPCCGAGSMFVQSDVFAHHSGKLSFFGQESKEFTFRLCRLNLFIHGIDGDIRPGNSYTNADYLLANPPSNDGAEGENGWGAKLVSDKDARLRLPGKTNPLPLSPRNANTMWMLHFLAHLKDHTSREPGGTAGFVMATGKLSNSEVSRLAVRKALVEAGLVDCVVTLTGQLFANTQIPCALWFLSKNRDGGKGYRARKNEILFIDGRKLGSLIPGSRKQKQLSAEEIERMAAVHRQFKRERAPDAVPGLCSVASRGCGNKGTHRRSGEDATGPLPESQRDVERQGDGRLHEPTQLREALRCAQQAARLPGNQDCDDRQLERRPAGVESGWPHYHQTTARNDKNADEGHRRPAQNRHRPRHVADRHGHSLLAHPLRGQTDGRSHPDAGDCACEPHFQQQAGRLGRGFHRYWRPAQRSREEIHARRRCRKPGSEY